MYNASTYRALAQSRQQDLLNEARQRQLAALAPKQERSGRFARVVALVRRNRPVRPAATATS
jgi:hypothetical protein